MHNAKGENMGANIEVHALPEGIAAAFRDNAQQIRRALKPQRKYHKAFCQIPAASITPEKFAQVQSNYAAVLAGMLEHAAELANFFEAVAEHSDAHEAALMSRLESAWQINELRN